MGSARVSRAVLPSPGARVAAVAGAHAYHGERAHGGVVSDGCAKRVRAAVLTPAVGVGCLTKSPHG
eukprot:7386675-Prymnesium_polylepis.1